MRAASIVWVSPCAASYRVGTEVSRRASVAFGIAVELEPT